jgi:hypothetical protein
MHQQQLPSSSTQVNTNIQSKLDQLRQQQQLQLQQLIAQQEQEQQRLLAEANSNYVVNYDNSNVIANPLDYTTTASTSTVRNGRKKVPTRNAQTRTSYTRRKSPEIKIINETTCDALLTDKEIRRRATRTFMSQLTPEERIKRRREQSKQQRLNKIVK